VSVLEKLLIKRLRKIRSDLDLYIELHLFDSISEEKADKSQSGVMDSFISAMHITDEYEDDDAFEEEIEELQVRRETVVPRNEWHIPANKVYAPQMRSVGGFADISHLPDIDKILEEKEETFSNMLLRLIDEKGLKDSDVYKRANIDRRLLSKIRGDEDYTPSKKTAIAFCLALCLDVDEANELLETAGYTLSASSRFDLIIMYLMEHKEYNIHFVNMVLDDYGEGTLSK